MEEINLEDLKNDYCVSESERVIEITEPMLLDLVFRAYYNGACNALFTDSPEYSLSTIEKVSTWYTDSLSEDIRKNKFEKYINFKTEERRKEKKWKVWKKLKFLKRN